MSAKPAVLVTRTLPEAVERRLAADFDARLNPDDRPLGREALLAAAMGANALLPCPADRIDAALIEDLPDSVRIIATFSVGYDHIDLDACRARGIAVTNTPGVLTEATAEVALLCMLGAARRAWEGQRMVHGDRWSGWAPTQLLGTQLAGRRLGIVGMGRIGQAVARRAAAFDMTVHYHNRHRLPAEQEAGAIYHDTVEALLSEADVLSLHCPATPETVGLLDAKAIERLPAGAIVVNTARGPLVDDAALIAALMDGRVAAAGLDVYTGEPDLHAGYRALDNVFLLPHLGSATVETRNAMGFVACDNLDAFFAGKAPPNQVV